jgi:hypothetical protein
LPNQRASGGRWSTLTALPERRSRQPLTSPPNGPRGVDLHDGLRRRLRTGREPYRRAARVTPADEALDLIEMRRPEQKRRDQP